MLQSLQELPHIRSTTGFFSAWSCSGCPFWQAHQDNPDSQTQSTQTHSAQSCRVLPLSQMQALPLTCYSSLCFCPLPGKGFLARAPAAGMH